VWDDGFSLHFLTDFHDESCSSNFRSPLVGNNLFSVEKVIQVLSYLQEHTEEKNYTILLKLIFFADRFSIRKYAIPVLHEPVYYAMKNGPVASRTYNMIKKDDFFLAECSNEERNLVDKYINNLNYGEIKIGKIEEYDLLSNSDIESLDFVIENFKGLERIDIINLTHQYPEWAKYEELLKLSSRETMAYEDFFDNPRIENLENILKIAGIDDPFVSSSEQQADLSLTKEVFLTC